MANLTKEVARFMWTSQCCPEVVSHRFSCSFQHNLFPFAFIGSQYSRSVVSFDSILIPIKMHIMRLAISATIVFSYATKAAALTDIDTSENKSLASLLSLKYEPTDNYADALFWARFCDDDQCAHNCGIWVSMDNPNCLKEVHRKSILMKPVGSPHDDHIYNAILSPERGCECRQECIDLEPIWFKNNYTGVFCWDISQYHFKSLRFRSDPFNATCSTQNWTDWCSPRPKRTEGLVHGLPSVL
ncbi:hypothetical protein F5Y16DRAFT_116893 [Xylariaceae sp. FL0255]|nr:hypothetical protein F5Y16DRAFT_116893 [Xylariaceae sp. FL0255]